MAEKEAQMRAVVENVPGGVFLLDADLNFFLTNNRYVEIFNIPDGLADKGKPIEGIIRYLAQHDVYGEGNVDELIERRLAQIRSDMPPPVEVSVDNNRYLMVYGQMPGGEQIGIVTDITELKEAEEQLRKARDAAEEATRAKATFLATMSHEIRTPMGGVIGMIDLLQETKLNADQRQMMGTVRDSAFSLLNIINDILDFSKIEAGKLSLESIPVSVRDLIESVTETMVPSAADKDLRLVSYIDPEIPASIMGDPIRLRQILFNLAGNAIKFTSTIDDQRGQVSIRADRVASRAKKKVTVRFSVSDNGIGMDDEAVVGLFQPFSQAEQSTTRRFGGTGLGLSICKNLSELMKGKVKVESTLGKGSTFSLTVPFPVAPDNTTQGGEQPLSGLRVLVLVGAEDTRAFITSYLEHGGADFQCVDTLQSAAAAYKADSFDVVVAGSEWRDEARETVVAELRSVAKEDDMPRFVLLTSDRGEQRGMVVPDRVVVEDEPLPPASFIRAVELATGRRSPEATRVDLITGKAKVRAPGIEEARAMGQLILVAEDNLTNQDVIRRQLNLLGYACEIGADGVEALRMWRSGGYAMLLTDCHMPEMDGFQLTGSIRDAETDERLPIVAITANVLQGEAGRCIAAGMDEYLSKPIEMPKLKAALKKWMPAQARTEVEVSDAKLVEAGNEVADVSSSPAVDVSALTEVFGDDPDTVREILQDFIGPATDNVAEIEEAMAQHSAGGVRSAAHKLKSSARAVGANELADLCAKLELAGKEGDLSTIADEGKKLSGAMEQVIQFINGF
ncbi:MAG: hypothetical protein DRQ37_04150 [Gammaproteobacteria bacterium]|nr:MAG: hypothetical protein DRQ37_04150 [Gammaproteobacteria bacterium]